MVERESDAVVAQVREQAEGLVETHAGHAVGAVSSAQSPADAHVGLTFRVSARAMGASPSTAGGVRLAPDRAACPSPAPRAKARGVLVVAGPGGLVGAYRCGWGEGGRARADHRDSRRRSANDSSAVNCSERPDGPPSGSLK